MENRNFKNNISKRENMKYDAEKDEYICHSGKYLRAIGTASRESASGYKTELTVYECEDCIGYLRCPGTVPLAKPMVLTENIYNKAKRRIYQKLFFTSITSVISV